MASPGRALAGSRRSTDSADFPATDSCLPTPTVEVIRERRSWWGKRPEVPPAPTLFSTAQIAAQLRISVSTVNSLARDRGVGRLVGDARVFTPDEVEELRAARNPRRGQPPMHQTHYSLTAAAVKLALPRELLAEHAELLGLGRGMLSDADLARLRTATLEAASTAAVTSASTETGTSTV